MEAPTFLGMILPDIPVYVSYSWLAILFLIFISLIIRSKLSLIPAGIQNFMEVIMEFLMGQAQASIGSKYARTFIPLLGTLFLYILTCNLFGLIPGFDSPTGNLNTNAAMAVPVFFLYHFYGFKVHGIRYLEHFLGPIRSIYAIPFMAFMFIVEWISHIARPITLSVRLFGNMMSKHLLLGVLGVLTPLLVPTLVLILGTAVSFIQAYIFMILTAAYIGGAVEEHH
ncbi:MAG: F0F1 ATP synthase subunit A [Thermodesulfovibrio sp.]|nr:F0F1 ATP synthase subunit A [Thermodesulfovibrio sp.]